MTSIAFRYRPAPGKRSPTTKGDLFMTSLLMAPRASRWAASVFASLALADFLQFAYAWAEQRAQD